MTENRNNTDIKTRYEFLIAGILVIVLCISAFTIYKITSYIKSEREAGQMETSEEQIDGTVLIEVEIRESQESTDPDLVFMTISLYLPLQKPVRITTNTNLMKEGSIFIPNLRILTARDLHLTEPQPLRYWASAGTAGRQ